MEAIRFFNFRSIFWVLLFFCTVLLLCNRLPPASAKASVAQENRPDVDVYSKGSAEGSQESQGLVNENEDAANKRLQYAAVNGQAIGPSEVRFLLRELRPVSQQQAQLVKRLLSDNAKLLQTAFLSDAESAGSELADKKESKNLALIDGLSENEREAVLALRKAIVDQWIERLIVLTYLRSIDAVVSEAEVNAELKLIEEKLIQQGDSFAALRKRLGVSRQTFVTDILWRKSWEQFVDQRINDQSLRKYYELKKRQFDGTRLKVAHVVKVFAAVSTVDEKKFLLEQCLQWKKQIEAGDCTFSQIVSEHSDGTSADRGGVLGWIDATGPQSEAFTAAAFQTTVGGISDPVETSSGAHLIHVIEEERGTIPFVESKSKVRTEMVSDLWDWVVDRHRTQVSIQR